LAAHDLPGLPEIATVSAWGIDSDKSDEYFLVTTDFLTPTCLLRGIAGGDPPIVLKRMPAFFRVEGLEAKQFEALSLDGTRVPYFLVSRTGLEHNGANPTLLYGYGGFENSIVPYYDANAGASWLEAGGVFVVANIRGGGEFGPHWHQAALKEKRPRAYQDFIAIAEDLIARGVTSAKHLGAMGGLQRWTARRQYAHDPPRSLWGHRVHDATAGHASIPLASYRRGLGG
jgi:prolyl oligopeptidase